MHTNKNARIAQEMELDNTLVTRTDRRDSGADGFEIQTDMGRKATILEMTFYGDCFSLMLDGRQARTLYRLLSKHYDAL